MLKINTIPAFDSPALYLGLNIHMLAVLRYTNGDIPPRSSETGCEPPSGGFAFPHEKSPGSFDHHSGHCPFPSSIRSKSGGSPHQRLR
jgi:hypothetical protein